MTDCLRRARNAWGGPVGARVVVAAVIVLGVGLWPAASGAGITAAGHPRGFVS